MPPARPGRVALLASGAALAAAAGLYFVNPNTTHVPLCPLRALTGLWCPICGATRASYALVHADPATALRDNALFVAALPLLVLMWLRWLRPGRVSEHGRLLPRPVFWSAVVLALVFGVVRNLAFGSALAPPG